VGSTAIPLPFRLGPYELVALLGHGGMGEVYRARDTRLNRTVAIKLLPPALNDSPHARSRFLREARAIASLSHPNVCIVHDVGDEAGLHFIVMEYLEGEPLAACLSRGPLSAEQVLQRGIEIADGLDHAHGLGVVHRDIKPGNIILTKGGAKLVDFGLAALRSSIFDRETVEDASITKPGQIMGTLQYMAPEQLEGKETDARTDLFACGLVLYEMATGKRAFGGSSSAAIISAILGGTIPSIREVEATYSTDLDWAIRRCLGKTPQERWQSAADLAAVLRWIQRKTATGSEDAQRPPLPKRRWPTAAAASAAAVAIVLATWFAARQWQSAGSINTAPVRASIRLAADAVISDDGSGAIALSHDSTRLAYSAAVKGTTGLYLRHLDRLDATLLPGTEGASSPFFSPDGSSIAFYAAGKLKKVALDGSSPVVLCDAPRGRGGSWVSADTIVFAPSSDTPLFRVRAAGGDPEPLTVLSEHPRERSHRWPALMPDGRAVLFTAGNPSDSVFSDAQIVIQSLVGAKERRVLVEGAAHARYADGHLLYLKGGSLVAAPFDPDRLELVGNAVTLVEDAARSRYLGSVQFAVSAGGALVYLPATDSRAYLTWISRDGRTTRVGDVKGPYFAPRLSPDGTRIAVDIDDGQGDIGVYDLATGNFHRSTHTPEFDGHPVWSPDGTRFLFASERGPGVQMFWKRWNDFRGAPGALAQVAAGHPPLAPGEYARVPHSWSPDGRFVAFTENHPDTRRNIWIAQVDGGGEPYPLIVSPFEDTQPVFSPDGKWLAYQSNDQGPDAIYVQALPKAGARILVSADHASAPRWAQSGEIFFWKAGRMFAVRVSPVGNTLKVGTPTPLFEHSSRPSYDVAPDGRRFLFAQPDPVRTPRDLVLLSGWRAALPR
jgi:serine/threonine protein kinase/Tol biopolymer transport system component